MNEGSQSSFRPLWVELLIATILLVGFGILAQIVLSSPTYLGKWEAIWKYRGPILRGWWITVGISAGCLVLATIFGILLVIGQRAGSIVLKRFCQGYIEFIRGTPLIVHLFIGYFVIATAMKINEPALVGVFSLSLFSAAYLAEIIRGGVDSIAGSQRQAAAAVGFTHWQSYRFVIIPQTVRRILPSVAGEFANLIKNSSLLSFIAVGDFFKQLNDAKSNTYTTFEIYLPMLIGYLLLTIPVALLARYLERRFAYES